MYVASYTVQPVVYVTHKIKIIVMMYMYNYPILNFLLQVWYYCSNVFMGMHIKPTTQNHYHYTELQSLLSLLYLYTYIICGVS